jgi:hypothetical protein
MTTIETLKETAEILKTGAIPVSSTLWGGADVIISRKPRSYRNDPFVVLTPMAGELSWLFCRLRDAFYAEDLIDGCSKIEFFGRLARAADRCIRQGHGDSAFELCLAVLHEAFVIYDELEAGTFRYLLIAQTGIIVDDSTCDHSRSGFRNLEDTIQFFSDRGFDLA